MSELAVRFSTATTTDLTGRLMAMGGESDSATRSLGATIIPARHGGVVGDCAARKNRNLMTSWEMMIDGTSFGSIAVYLRHPQSPIDFILHVKDRAMLSEVATRIEQDSRSWASTPGSLPPPLLALVRAGAMKVSSRHPLEHIDSSALIDVDRVNRTAFTEVIYQPPYYLAHTPGLLELKVMVKDPSAQRTVMKTPMKTLHELEIRLKDRDYGHDH